MNERVTGENHEIRLMGIEQLCAYIGLGKTAAAEWGKRIGANVKLGKRSLYDKRIVDKAIDEMKG